MWQDYWKIRLSKCRERIDTIDKEIIESIECRLRECKEIAEIKANHNLPIYVPERELLVIKNRQEIGKRHGLSEDFIKELLLLIMNESKDWQAKVIGILQTIRS